MDLNLIKDILIGKEVAPFQIENIQTDIKDTILKGSLQESFLKAKIETIERDRSFLSMINEVLEEKKKHLIKESLTRVSEDPPRESYYKQDDNWDEDHPGDPIY
jgi:hypothetical protein